MSYPNAYCVKCGSHTATLEKHTVMLQNRARALKGVCPACMSDVYKILPKGKAFLAKTPLTASERRRYPDAFCVKCQEHTPTVNPHTVLFENLTRAVTGSCGKCGSEVYRILGTKNDKAAAESLPAAAPVKTVLTKAQPRSPLSESLRKTSLAKAPAESPVAKYAQATQAKNRRALIAAGAAVAVLVAALVAYSALTLQG